MRGQPCGALIVKYHLLPTCPADPKRIRAKTGYQTTPRSVLAAVFSREKVSYRYCARRWEGSRGSISARGGSSLFASFNPDDPQEPLTV